MTLIRHELRRGWKSLLIWTCAIAAFMMISLVIFPEMKNQMDSISTVFASMGAFTKAFGMETLNFGTLTGFYGIECGNILGIGGALFAALLALYKWKSKLHPIVIIVIAAVCGIVFAF